MTHEGVTKGNAKTSLGARRQAMPAAGMLRFTRHGGQAQDDRHWGGTAQVVRKTKAKSSY
jgi:hypothetical protein